MTNAIRRQPRMTPRQIDRFVTERASSRYRVLNELIRLAEAARPMPTDRAIAKKLGYTTGTVSVNLYRLKLDGVIRIAGETRLERVVTIVHTGRSTAPGNSYNSAGLARAQQRSREKHAKTVPARRDRLVALIDDLAAAGRPAPTLAAMGAELEVAATVVMTDLKALGRAGVLVRAGRGRNYRITVAASGNRTAPRPKPRPAKPAATKKPRRTVPKKPRQAPQRRPAAPPVAPPSPRPVETERGAGAIPVAAAQPGLQWSPDADAAPVERMAAKLAAYIAQDRSPASWAELIDGVEDVTAGEAVARAELHIRMLAGAKRLHRHGASVVAIAGAGKLRLPARPGEAVRAADARRQAGVVFEALDDGERARALTAFRAAGGTVTRCPTVRVATTFRQSPCAGGGLNNEGAGRVTPMRYGNG